MLIFGHPYFKNSKFYHISDIKHIDHTPSNSMLLFNFNEENLDLIDFATTNDLPFSLLVQDLKEALFAENFDASYILSHEKCIKAIQTAADTYLFDAKILCQIDNDKKIEELAKSGIDGVIFAEAIIKA